MRGTGLPLAFVLAAWGCNGDARRSPSADSAVSPVPPAVPLSHFNAPLRYDFSAMLRAVDRAVPTQFGALDSVHQVGDDTHRHYAFEATRAPFTAFAEGPLIHLEATVAYKGRGFFKPPIGPTLSAGCGTQTDQPPRIVAELVTPLTLTANWHLASHAALARLEPASDSARDRCRIRLVRYDVTPRILDAARSAINDHLADIDRRIAEVDLTEHFVEWWKALSRPIRLTDGVWLLLDPQRLRMGSVTGKGRVLTVQVGLDARPRIVTRADEPPTAVTPLPPLAHGTVTGGFHILMEGIVDYATASRALTAALAGRLVTEHHRTVTFQTVTLSPAPRGRLAMAATFGGDAHGTLRFLGTPQHDSAAHAITVPDLDYDLRTNNQVINAYAWLRSDALRAMFRTQARVPDGPGLEEGRALLLSGLNRKLGDAMTLSATVDSVAVRGLFTTEAGLVLRAEAFGHATAAVKPR